jgi:hypothetical protein
VPILDRLELDLAGRRLPPAVEADGYSERDPGEAEELFQEEELPLVFFADDQEDVLGAVRRIRGGGRGQWFVGKDSRKAAAVFEEAKKRGIGGNVVFIERGSHTNKIFKREKGVIYDSFTIEIDNYTVYDAYTIDELEERDLSDRLAELRERRRRAREEADSSEQTEELEDLDSEIYKLAQMLAASKTGAWAPSSLGTRFINLPVHEISSSDYQLDRDLGVVKFKAPAGTLYFTIVDQINKSRLVPAKAFLTYATEQKPNLAKNGVGGQRFTAEYVWIAGRAKQFDRISGDAHVTPVYEEELQLQIKMSGETNLAWLQERADEIARSRLEVQSVILGGRHLFASFEPVSCNGLVSSVSWSSDGTSALTSVYTGHPADGQQSGVPSARLDRALERGGFMRVRPAPPGWVARSGKLRADRDLRLARKAIRPPILRANP